MATKKKLKKSTAAAAKVSPSKGMNVDAWLRQNVPPAHAKLVIDLLALVKKQLPKATVSIKWNQPVVEQNGPLAFVRAAKNHVTFGFWRGAELDAPEGLLEGTGDRMRHLKIASAADHDPKLISKLLRQAAKLNAELGDPTRRK